MSMADEYEDRLECKLFDLETAITVLRDKLREVEKERDTLAARVVHPEPETTDLIAALEAWYRDRGADYPVILALRAYRAAKGVTP